MDLLAIGIYSVSLLIRSYYGFVVGKENKCVQCLCPVGPIMFAILAIGKQIPTTEMKLIFSIFYDHFVQWNF